MECGDPEERSAGELKSDRQSQLDKERKREERRKEREERKREKEAKPKDRNEEDEGFALRRSSKEKDKKRDKEEGVSLYFASVDLSPNRKRPGKGKGGSGDMVAHSKSEDVNKFSKSFVNNDDNGNSRMIYNNDNNNGSNTSSILTKSIKGSNKRGEKKALRVSDDLELSSSSSSSNELRKDTTPLDRSRESNTGLALAFLSGITMIPLGEENNQVSGSPPLTISPLNISISSTSPVAGSPTKLHPFALTKDSDALKNLNFDRITMANVIATPCEYDNPLMDIDLFTLISSGLSNVTSTSPPGQAVLSPRKLNESQVIKPGPKIPVCLRKRQLTKEEDKEREKMNSLFYNKHVKLKETGITLSRMRKAKYRMVRLVFTMNLDIGIVAMSFVAFDRLVYSARLFREDCYVGAAACLLLCYKFYSVSTSKRQVIKILEHVSKNFHIPINTILSIEYIVYVLLNFRLHHPPEIVLPYYNLIEEWLRKLTSQSIS